MKAAALAPRDLRLLLERFETEFRQGLEDAQSGEGSESHQYFVLSRKGRLRDRIATESRTAVTMIRRREAMPEVVRRLGVIAHLVADANNPFHAAEGDPRLTPLRNDFAHYFERSLPKFPTVFYGLDPGYRLPESLDKTFRRSAGFYPLVREEYFRGGQRRTSASFDDRSTAFGVAAISYSRAVSDLVNLYYFIWKEAGGDVRSAGVMRQGNLLLHETD